MIIFDGLTNLRTCSVNLVDIFIARSGRGRRGDIPNSELDSPFWNAREDNYHRLDNAIMNT